LIFIGAALWLLIDAERNLGESATPANEALGEL
jgi:hypothetical protein